jgi:pyrimidine operon attenuation protein / uracil phosphoribosyltransferase
MQTLLDGAQISQLLAAMADEIVADEMFQLKATPKKGLPVALVGIRSRGELLAYRLADLLAARTGNPNAKIDAGALDITFYRDDLASRHAITIPQGTDMNFRIDDRPVILVDDVLETGRSARAALDGLVAFGRPSIIRLAVLVDRGGREFPIAADFVGMHVTETAPDQKIRVRLKPTDPEDIVYLEEGPPLSP